MIDQYIKNNKNFIFLIKDKKINNKKLNSNQLFIIINALKFYDEYKISPSIKMLIFYIKKNFGQKYGNIKYIKNNFKNLNLIYKISNLNNNINCFLD
ncbi:TusE/DsrC/DsvC family sulfur relay protein [Candidatus Nardonella dryophthoridicola]|uniref:Sulfurtransferase n=1 Tax=endosymbiont of Rhynchophorus ferrugineus TaxID=1972133 RepID=A0A2Z5TP88_9GAMM|nr:TusE/DsrC/DsvC family sulfur relay protein [Candidatus Nardonella dryophthoridicola]QTJ62796.1 TusE/DsrC/DsvC family sulfur relay protein [Candidatus Nardonella dryophthoridicola]BBA85039.1 sulfurtransferase [endosymbiont of Rhynchophorus ferrugineus]